MENLICSNAAWYLVALLAITLTAAATIQVRLGVVERASKRRIGFPQRAVLAHSLEHLPAIHGICQPGATRRSTSSAPKQTRRLPGISSFGFVRAHGAPAHGKERTPC